MTFGGNIPYTTVGQRLAGLRLPGEQPLAVLERPDVGEGPARAQDRLRVPAPRFPVPRLGGQAHGRAVQLQPPRHRRLRRAGQQPVGQTGDPFASFLLGQVQHAESDHPGVQPTFSETYTGLLGQRRVQGLGQADADPRPALRLSVRAHRDDRISTRRSTRPRRIPGAGGIPGALIFAGDGPGRSGTAEVRGRAEGCVGPAGRLRLSARREETRFAAATGSTTPASRSTSSSVSRRWVPGEPARAEHHQRHLPGVPSRPGVPAGPDHPAAVHRSELRQRQRERRGRDARRADAAALPELVGDLPAPAHRQHDAGRLLHRESRQPPEPPLRRRWASTRT